MKQIIYDYIHCTDLEFLIKHPFVTVVLPVAIALVLIWFIPWFINRRNKK